MSNSTVLAIIMCLLVDCFEASAYAQTDSFQEGKAVAREAVHGETFDLSHFSPAMIIDDFSSESDLSRLERNEQFAQQPLDAVGRDIASSVAESQAQRPHFNVDARELGVAKSIGIEENATVLLANFGDCQTQESHCETSWETHHCEIAKTTSTLTCQENLQVEVVSSPGENTPEECMDVVAGVTPPINAIRRLTQFPGSKAYPKGLPLWLVPSTTQCLKDWVKLSRASINANHSKITVPANRQATLALKAFDTSCAPQGGQLILQDGGQTLAQVSTLSRVTIPATHNARVVTMTYSQPQQRCQPYVLAAFYLAPQPPTTQIVDTWVSTCQPPQGNQCQRQVGACLQPEETRIIDGVPITRPCWQREVRVTCRGQDAPPIANSCAPWQEAGCEQINSVCASSDEQTCERFLQTYRCPIERCDSTPMLACDNAMMCLEGDCQEPVVQEDSAFGESVASLATLMAAGDDVGHGMSIFAGDAQDCRTYSANFNDCCQRRGWGGDLGLAHCSQAEKALAKARVENRAIKVGRYCKEDVLGVCVEYRTVFCTFPTVLASLVQQQGRLGQLAIDFGKAKEPNCSGLTPTELQSIAFEQLDLTLLYADIEARLSTSLSAHDKADLTQQVMERVKTLEAAS